MLTVTADTAMNGTSLLRNIILATVVVIYAKSEGLSLLPGLLMIMAMDQCFRYVSIYLGCITLNRYLGGIYSILAYRKGTARVHTDRASIYK